MELDTFILTVEDFLEGIITDEFLQEEINYTKEEFLEKRQVLNNEISFKLLSAIEEMMKYFTVKPDKEYVRTGLDKVKEINKIFKTEGNGTEHLISPGPDYAIPSGMKIPAGDYYKEEKNHTDYVSDPVESPLYSLLIGYEELAAEKITTKDWIEQLIDSQEELYYLLEKIDEHSEDIDIDIFDFYTELVQQAITILEDLEIKYSEEEISQEQSRKIIEEIRFLNKEIYKYQGKFPVKENYDIKDSIQEAYEKFQEEDYKTGNYIIIEEHIQKYLDGSISEEDFLDAIKKIKNVISSVEEQYENLPISQEELTLEVIRGDKLLTEGLMLWQEGLEIIEDCIYCETKDKDMFREGLANIFKGNKRLVILQYFSEQIQRQVQLQKTFQEGMTEGTMGT
ncbi:MAG: hypothetical protein ABRQ37_18870 [Candidatus Eremiobacterota bacterium]